MDGSSVFDGEDASARLPERGVELDIVGAVVDDYSPGFGRIRAIVNRRTLRRGWDRL